MKKMKNNRLMGLFSDFDEAHDAIAGIRQNAVPGLTVVEVFMESPVQVVIDLLLILCIKGGDFKGFWWNILFFFRHEGQRGKPRC